MQDLLPYALILACPISMGVMMWLMMRGPRQPADQAALQRRVEELERAARQTPGEAGLEPAPKDIRPEPEARPVEA